MMGCEDRLQRGALILGVAMLLLLAAQETAAQSGSLIGRWVGGYHLGDGWESVVVTFDGDGYLLPRQGSPVLLQELVVAGDAVSFRAGDLIYEGHLLEEETVAGLVRRGEAEGSFVLMPLSATMLEVYDSAIGTYRLTDDRVLLVGRSDGTDGLLIVEGEKVVPIVPTGPDRFFSASGEEIVLSRGAPDGSVDGLYIKPWSRLEISYPLLGERVELYHEELVQFGGGLSGTLLLPLGEGPHPAVALIHGAGASQREYYRIYGDYFARQGIAALIYDKRGEERPGLDGLASDVLAGVHLLQGHALIDPRRVGVWGISQGGRVAPMVAAESSEVAFVVTLSAPGFSADQLELWGVDRRSRTAGSPNTLVEMILKATRLRQSWGNLTSLRGSELVSDPLLSWRDVSQPVLLIYGGLDGVVPPRESAAAIHDALAAGGNQNVTLSLYSEADHNLMIPAEGGVQAAAPGMMAEMVDWILTGRPAGGLPAPDGPGGFESGGAFSPTPWHQGATSHLLVTFVAGLILIASLSHGLLARFRRRRRPDSRVPDRFESLSVLLGCLGCLLLWQFWALVWDLDALGARAGSQLDAPSALPLTVWTCLTLWLMSLSLNLFLLWRILDRGKGGGTSVCRRIRAVVVFGAAFAVLIWMGSFVILG